MENNEEIGQQICEILDDKGIKYKINSTQQLILDTCLFCGKSNKLYVSLNKNGVYNCFSCGGDPDSKGRGNAVMLIAKVLDISYKEAAKILHNQETIEISKIKEEYERPENNTGLILNLSGFKKNSLKNELKLPEPIKLIEEFVILDENSNKLAWDYLINRGYTAEVIHQLKLYVLPFNNYADTFKYLSNKYKRDFQSDEELKNFVKKSCLLYGRIVFPMYIENEIYGYVARDYTGSLVPKVLNSSVAKNAASFRNFFVWNYDNARNSKSLVICEGTTSAIKCGINRSIALLGKAATQDQLRLIRKMNANKVYLCLDLSTDAEQIKMLSYLNLFFNNEIYKVDLPPLLMLKQSFNEEEIKYINECLPNLNMTDTTKSIIISPNDKNILKEYIKKLYEKKSINDDFYIEFYEKLKKAEYKDAGDYTYAEMEEFIQSAQKYKYSILSDD